MNLSVKVFLACQWSGWFQFFSVFVLFTTLKTFTDYILLDEAGEIIEQGYAAAPGFLTPPK